MALGLGLGLGIGRRGATTNVLAALINEGTILGSTFARAGNQWNPDTAAYETANNPVTRNVVIGGRTIPLTLVERAGTNLATQLATAAYALPATARTAIWWNGAAGDYTLTTNGAGTFAAKTTTADGRNYQILTGHAAANTVTCTRNGSPTNDHLQVEQVDYPTSKMAFSGSRTEVDKRATGMTTNDTNTFVMLFQPYGWTQNIGPNDAGVQYFRTSGGSSMYFAKSDATRPTFSRSYNGGSGSAVAPFMPIDGRNRMIAFRTGLVDVTDVRPSGRGWNEFMDGTGFAVKAATPGTTPITAITGLDIGSYASAAANRQCNGWIALLQYTRLLTNDEIDLLAVAFEGATGYVAEYAGWGDSFMAYQANLTWGEKLFNNTGIRVGNRWYNGGVASETVAQIKTRFDAASARLKRCFTIFECMNSQDLAGIQAMVNTLGHSRYLVLGQFNNATTMQSGTSGYNTMVAYNASLAAAFGANYFDWRSYMITQNVTPGDDADTAADCVGTSMRGDALHMNANGHLIAATKLSLVLTALGYTYP